MKTVLHEFLKIERNQLLGNLNRPCKLFQLFHSGTLIQCRFDFIAVAKSHGNKTGSCLIYENLEKVFQKNSNVKWRIWRKVAFNFEINRLKTANQHWVWARFNVIYSVINLLRPRANLSCFVTSSCSGSPFYVNGSPSKRCLACTPY